jgi:hypothetical protein
MYHVTHCLAPAYSFSSSSPPPPPPCSRKFLTRSFPSAVFWESRIRRYPHRVVIILDPLNSDAVSVPQVPETLATWSHHACCYLSLCPPIAVLWASQARPQSAHSSTCTGDNHKDDDAVGVWLCFDRTLQRFLSYPASHLVIQTLLRSFLHITWIPPCLQSALVLPFPPFAPLFSLT